MKRVLAFLMAALLLALAAFWFYLRRKLLAEAPEEP